MPPSSSAARPSIVVNCWRMSRLIECLEVYGAHAYSGRSRHRSVVRIRLGNKTDGCQQGPRVVVPDALLRAEVTSDR